MMNREQTMTIADKLTRSWPRSSITADTWETMLADAEWLTYGVADAAMRQLIGTLTHPPSIAEYFTACRTQLGTARPRDVEACDRCGGTGLVTVGDPLALLVDRCHCRNGIDARTALNRIIEANANEPALISSRGYQRAGTTGPPPRKERPV